MASVLKGGCGIEALRARELILSPNMKKAGKFRADSGRVCHLVWLEQREEIMKIKTEENVGKISWDPVMEDFNLKDVSLIL